MKKSIVALAIAAAAVSGAASASVDIYSANGLSVQVSGEVDAYLKGSQWDPDGGDEVANDPEATAWGMVQFDAQYRISNSTTAFASFELEGDGNSGVSTDDVVAGFINDSAGKFSLGETGDALDAIEKTDITNEGPYLATMSHTSESDGKGLRWQKNVDGLELSADIQTDSESQNNAYGVSLDWAVNDVFTIGAAYTDFEEDTNVLGLSASAEFDNVYLAATVSQYENMGEVGYGSHDDEETFAKTDGLSYGVAGAYQMDKTRLYATVEMIDADSLPGSSADIDASLLGYTVGVDHQVVDNVLVFAEYSGLDADGDDLTEGHGDRVVLGAYLTF